MKPEQSQALRAPFPPTAVSKLDRGNGVVLDYVGHAGVTSRLLEVDPEWTWEPVAFADNGLPRFDDLGGLWIRLTVCGVTRLGYGDAAGTKGPNAVKEAVGDGIRNAAMRFGVALDLWSKDDIGSTAPPPPKPVATSDQILAWVAAINTSPDMDHLTQIAHELAAHDLGEHHQDLVDAWSVRRGELTGNG